MKISAVCGELNAVDCEIIIAGFYSNVRPVKGIAGEIDWFLNGAISQLIISNKISGFLGEAILLATQGKIFADKVLLLGMGEYEDFGMEEFYNISSKIGYIISKMKVKDFAAEMFCPEDSFESTQIKYFIETILSYIKASVVGDRPRLTIITNKDKKLVEINKIIKRDFKAYKGGVKK